jgi:hypothetical protein
MQRVAALLPAWRSSASAAAREPIAVALQEHHAALIEHLDDEEQYVLRLIAEHLTVAEWQAVGERGMKHVQKDRKHALIALGLILEEADAQETAFSCPTSRHPRGCCGTWSASVSTAAVRSCYGPASDRDAHAR